MNKYYLISSNDNAVKEFYAQPCGNIFTLVPGFDENSLNLTSVDMLFNITKAEQILQRYITHHEIARTLSHILCWKRIANDNDIQDHEFAVIAEPQVNLINHFLEAVGDYIGREANNHPFDIILLQRKLSSSEQLHKKGDKPITILFHKKHYFNDIGAALYLIRKSRIKELLNLLTHEKPFWLADHFSEFCDYKKMAQASLLMGWETAVSKNVVFSPVSNPRFSIIVPVYNVDYYLKQCLDSILIQNYKKYEVILINDGSYDLSRDICEEYAKKYPQITVIHKPNSGVSESRNFGMKIARGEYIMFLDSDDYWNGSDILEKLSLLIDEKGMPDLIVNEMTSVYPDGELVLHTMPTSDLTSDFTKDYPFLVEYGAYQGFVCTKVIKRSVIEEHGIYFPYGLKFEDINWSYKLARFIKRYAYYSNAFATYRRNRKESITSQGANFSTASDLIKILYLTIDEIQCAKRDNAEIYTAMKTALGGAFEYLEKYFNLMTEEDKQRLLSEKEALCSYWKQFNQDCK
ncbi:glycosyltransferase [Pasteurellaceae bacterium LIM206]|nr:glycosyltransferase [Pasteurellaceae bacterium LIM206]